MRATSRLISDAATEMLDAQRDALDRLRREQPLDRRVDDARRGEHDERALEAAREVLGLAVPVAVVLVLRAGGGRQGDQRHDGRREIHQRLERVGEQADRPGDEVGAALERDRREGGDDRDDRVAAEGRAIFHDQAAAGGSIRSTSAIVRGALPSARLLTRR